MVEGFLKDQGRGVELAVTRVEEDVLSYLDIFESGEDCAGGTAGFPDSEVGAGGRLMGRVVGAEDSWGNRWGRVVVYCCYETNAQSAQIFEE